MGKLFKSSVLGKRRAMPKSIWMLLGVALLVSVVYDSIQYFGTSSLHAEDAVKKKAELLIDADAKKTDAKKTDAKKADASQANHDHKDGDQKDETAAGDGHAKDGHAKEDAHGKDSGHGDGHGDDHGGGHKDPVSPIVLAMAIILASAKVGGDLFERASMPAVLGELVVGILIGNAALLTGGWTGLDFLKPPEASHAVASVDEHKDGQTADQKLAQLAESSHHMEETIHNFNQFHPGAVLKMLAGIGVLILLFEVGLESSVAEMVSVGVSAMLVAVLGVVIPMVLGWGVGLWLVPELGWQVHAFMGATLCATSVGITARVLKDIGCSQRRESKIILGAAVVDDVLGLIVLAVISGIIQKGSPQPTEIAMIIVNAFGFLIGAVVLGRIIFTRPLFKAASYLRGHGLLVATSLVICFGFSYLSNSIFGLAPIVGAFAAGLILERAHYRELGDREDVELEHAIQPISAILVPIFFVQMGIQVDLTSFMNTEVLGLAAALTIVAIIGKQVCSFGVVEKGLNIWSVGLGMVPRGEVGLIFADVGRNLISKGEPVISKDTFSAIVVMVIVTTMITPPILKWSLLSGGGNNDDKLQTE